MGGGKRGRGKLGRERACLSNRERCLIGPSGTWTMTNEKPCPFWFAHVTTTTTAILARYPIAPNVCRWLSWDDGSSLRNHRIGTPFVQTTRRLNTNILAMPIWSNERSSGILETRERRSPPMDGDGNAMMEVTIEDFRGTCERIRTSLPCIDENFIRPYDRDLIRYTLSILLSIR